ncbi:MAG TPA: hypothetical protein VHX62_09145 [Solirubrobacteraceae bacterium]|jgi:hypothetical protein|nr:hypothetical protein [Solirubrobacteraceae bacterium]
MTTGDAAQLRTLAFGDVQGGVWGAVISAPAPLVAFGSGADALATDGPFDAVWDGDGRGWRLTGDGFDLRVASHGEDVTPEAADDGEAVSGFQELCRVQGTITLGGAERELQCIGTRSVIDGVDAGSLGSARAVAGWFADDEAFMLQSLRADEDAGQESDLVAATLFDPEGWTPVNDPRLSTTYTEAGVPTRANLELWIGEGEDEFPRRAAGEASGAGADLQTGPRRLRVVPLRCHSRGREGAGVYVLASF